MSRQQTAMLRITDILTLGNNLKKTCSWIKIIYSLKHYLVHYEDKEIRFQQMKLDSSYLWQSHPLAYYCFDSV